MQGVLTGFFAIWVVIGVGALLAHVKVLRTDAQLVLSQVSFFAGSPALLGLMMARADLTRVFSIHVVASLGAIAGAALLYLVAARIWWRAGLGHRVIATLCSSYVNAGNLGLPISAFVLGDVTWIAPVLLVQICILQPLGLALLDIDRARRGGRTTSWVRNLAMPLRNPLTLGTLLGLVVNLTGWTLPTPALAPVELLAGLAVPTMLLAFGVALRLGGRPSFGDGRAEMAWVVALKMLVMPSLAWVCGLALGLDQAALFAVTVIAALPTAQNVFVHAVRYDVGLRVAKDSIFITTIGSVPVILGIAVLLG